MKTRFLLLLTLVLGVFVGCNDIFTVEDNFEKSGKVIVKITDAPLPTDSVDSVMVEIDWIKFKTAEMEQEQEQENENGNANANSEEEDAEENADTVFTLDVAKRIDLLALQNGLTELLGEIEVPVGEYKEIRLHITDAIIYVKGEDPVELKIPGGSSSGLKIKIKPSLVVEEFDVVTLLLDFDLNRSINVVGNGKSNGKGKAPKYIFKPVIRAVNQAGTGSVEGMVTENTIEGDIIKNARVYVIDNGVDPADTVASAKSNKEGFYKIIGVPVGTYDMSCARGQYITADSTGVEIVEQSITIQNFELTKAEGDDEDTEESEDE